MQPEVKKAGKEQIKEKARESIREKLAKGKLDADRKIGSVGNGRGALPRQKEGYGAMRHLIFCGKRVPFSLSGGEKIECI